MKPTNFFTRISFFCILVLNITYLCAQNLQVTLSPQNAGIDRSVSSGIATIYFDSGIEDLEIICTEGKSNEPILKESAHRWYTHIDVKSDINFEGFCQRKYILKSASSAEYHLKTPAILPNQVLYYTITLPNELEIPLLESKAKNVAKVANRLIDENDSYRARRLLLEVLPNKSSKAAFPYIPEVEAAFRKSMENNNAVLEGHTGNVSHVAYSSDGTKIISSSWDNTIKIWDAQNGALLANMIGHNGIVNMATYCQNDRYIISTSHDKTIKIWDATSYRCIKTINTKDDRLNEVYFNPHNFRQILFTLRDSIVIMDWETNRVIRKSYCKANNVLYTPDGQRIILSYQDEIKTLDATTLQVLKTFKDPTGNITCMNINNDGNFIVSCSEENSVRIWQLSTGKSWGWNFNVNKKSEIDYYDKITSVQFSMGGQYLLVSTGYEYILWDIINEEKTIHETYPHPGITIAVFNPDNSQIACGSGFDKKVLIYDPLGLEECNILSGHTYDIQSVCYSHNGKYIASASRDQTIKIWDAQTLRLLRTLTGHQNWVKHVAFNASDSRLVSVSLDHTIRMWDVETGKELYNSFLIGTGVSCDFFPNNDYKIIINAEKSVVIKEAKNNFNHIGKISSNVTYPVFAISKDGKYIAISDKNSLFEFAIAIYNADNFQCIKRINCGHTLSISSLSFSSDGQQIMAALEDRAIKIWDWKADKLSLVISNEYPCTYATYSNDGKLIVSADIENIKIWDAKTGTKLYYFPDGHPILEVMFNPQGNQIVSASEQNDVKVWEFPSLEILREQQWIRFKDRALTPMDLNYIY